MVALVTPMNQHGDIDWNALAHLIDFHLQEGTDAIVAVGTTGESSTLEVSEHIEVIKAIVAQVAGKVPVIAGTGGNSTKESIALTQIAKDLKVDACLIVTPYYNKPTQEGLYQHFSAIAKAVNIPQILYNVPGRTGCDMLPETTLRLSCIKNIIGIKDATGDLTRGEILLDELPQNFAVYSGDDPTAAELMLKGAKGNISVTANIAPRAMHELCVAAMRGESSIARAINDRLALLNKVLFLESNPIPVKYALSEMGMIQSGLRLPLTELGLAFQGPLRQAMHQFGILS
ncbi:UNVERIFIED_CONTAM: hypothetical protein GTU68_008993 [Idotea baltica]|nr:hypothetical protein [Idotea baltica]